MNTRIPPIGQWHKEKTGKFTYYAWAFGAYPDRRYPQTEAYHIMKERRGVYVVQAWGFPPYPPAWEFVGRAKTPASAVVLARKHYQEKLRQHGLAPATGPGYQSRVMTMQGAGLQGYDNSAYTHFLVWWHRGAKSHIKIESGWEYKEDAQERLEAFKEEIAGRGVVAKVYTRKGLRQRGVDPVEDSRWVYEYEQQQPEKKTLQC